MTKWFLFKLKANANQRAEATEENCYANFDIILFLHWHGITINKPEKIKSPISNPKFATAKKNSSQQKKKKDKKIVIRSLVNNLDF